MGDNELILNAKASLFDFYDLLNKENPRTNLILERFHTQLSFILNAADAKLYLKQTQLDRFIPNNHIDQLTKIISTNEQSYEYLKGKISNPDKKVVSTTDIPFEHFEYRYPYQIIFQLNATLNVQGFYLFSFKEQPLFNDSTLHNLQQIIDKHFQFLCHHLHDQSIKSRNELLFQLSANLHSVNNTTDVLQRVYRSVKTLFPDFTFRFLMSHDYDISTVPIDEIEYENDDFLGTIAFINNQLIIDVDDEHYHTIIYSPLSGRQGVYGVIEVLIDREIFFTEADYEFIKQSSKMIGRAVERTTLYQLSTKLVSDLQMINVATRDLNKNLEQSEISENVKKHIMSSCKTEEIGIILLPTKESCEKDYVIAAESSSYFKSANAHGFIKYLFEYLRKHPEPVLSGNFKVDEFIVPFNSIMVIPMWDSEKIFGFIVIAHESPYYFSFDKYKLVQSFVQHAALAYINSMLKEKLRHTAITDYLTNLYLRNYLDEKVDEHMKTDHGGSFILLDVDDFKLVNDTHGHYVGDKVLIQIATIIKNTINDNEIAARWGGEEFAIYLPYNNEKYALQVADKIRQKVAVNTIPNVSISIGISTWNDKKHTIEKLFIEADEALYEAKSTGKIESFYPIN